MNSNCSNILALVNLQEQVKKHSVSKIGLAFQFFSILEHFFVTVGQNNFENKIPFFKDKNVHKTHQSFLSFGAQF